MAPRHKPGACLKDVVVVVVVRTKGHGEKRKEKNRKKLKEEEEGSADFRVPLITAIYNKETCNQSKQHCRKKGKK